MGGAVVDGRLEGGLGVPAPQHARVVAARLRPAGPPRLFDQLVKMVNLAKWSKMGKFKQMVKIREFDQMVKMGNQKVDSFVQLVR